MYLHNSVAIHYFVRNKVIIKLLHIFIKINIISKILVRFIPKNRPNNPPTLPTTKTKY